MKCGLGGQPFIFTMDGKPIERVNEEKDLGVWVVPSMKWDRNWRQAVAEGHRVLQGIVNLVGRRNGRMAVKLHTRYARIWYTNMESPRRDWGVKVGRYQEAGGAVFG
eukprot:GHVN01102622.1.p1 GENE.GHVN01102622.1~~GHVN01102622.1.p1  ORF type:complete len:107 (+),score=8.16 GHVN01102622.1:420-740(+)